MCHNALTQKSLDFLQSLTTVLINSWCMNTYMWRHTFLLQCKNLVPTGSQPVFACCGRPPLCYTLIHPLSQGQTHCRQHLQTLYERGCLFGEGAFALWVFTTMPLRLQAERALDSCLNGLSYSHIRTWHNTIWSTNLSAQKLTGSWQLKMAARFMNLPASSRGCTSSLAIMQD